MKTAVIGYSGCGKSTLARFLGEKYHTKILHLDCVHWLPGWQERGREEELNMVCQFMDQNHSWIIEGNYTGLAYDRRLDEADRIILMCFNRFACLFRVMKRVYTYQGKTRESMTPGCPEKLDLEFLIWILYKGRDRGQRRQYKKVRKMYADKMIVIRNQRQLTSYMRRGKI